MLGLTKYGRRELALLGTFWSALGLAAWHVFPPGVGLPAIGMLATALFFRDPGRRAPQGEENLVAPADGAVSDVSEEEHNPILGGPAIRIGIFLSILDVHVNRSPCTGRVAFLSYQPGRFHDARSVASRRQNEATTIVLDPGGGLGPVVVRQIAGAIARRIVCDLRAGQDVRRGQKIGMIKFGSRTELLLPRGQVREVCVRLGRRVKGGETILARFGAAR